MEAKNTIFFPAETLDLVQKIMKRYPEGKHKSAILPILHLAQAEWKWCSPEVMDYVASLLTIAPVEVYEVASFYTMFHLEPVGEHVIEYCRTGPCCLMGGVEVYDHLKKRLGIQTGETTADGQFTIKEVECLAACAWAVAARQLALVPSAIRPVSRHVRRRFQQCQTGRQRWPVPLPVRVARHRGRSGRWHRTDAANGATPRRPWPQCSTRQP